MSKPKISKSEVSQTFTLSELLSEKQIKTIKKQRKLGEFRKEFSNDAIQDIIERTQSGVDIREKSFKPYSKKYADKKGVSRNNVDLTLTGNMLGSVRGEKDQIKIKVGSGINTKKAYNHCVGDTLPKRNFFGLLQKDAKKLASEIYSDIVSEDSTPTPTQRQETTELTNQTIADLLDVEFTFDDI